MKSWSQTIDNAPLIIFRIFLGLLIAAESFGALFTGWIKKVFVESQFTFTHIGFEFLAVFHGKMMYFYFVIMGILGIFIALGFQYKKSIRFFTFLWFGAYLMQKEAYNNHYYMLFLVCLAMCFFPANASNSIDSKRNPEIKSNCMPIWISWFMISQITIVYLFSVLAKCYPDWLDGTFVKILFTGKESLPIIGSITQKKAFHLFISYSGLLFDLLIVPLLLFKKTRTVAFILAVFFHIFNAIVLQIGIFPFFALSFVVFFYPPTLIRKLFFRNKIADNFQINNRYNSVLKYFFIPFLLIQIALPLRHYFIQGDVLWTEEGHRLSWRMMLRSRSGTTIFRIVDKKTKDVLFYDVNQKLTRKQLEWFGNKPDGIWQMVQKIKKDFLLKNMEVAIYAQTYVSVNGSPYKSFVDPNVDLGELKWDYFKHNTWITDENNQTLRN